MNFRLVMNIRTTILRQSIFVDCRIFFRFSEHLSILKNPSHHVGVTLVVIFSSINSAVLSPSDWRTMLRRIRCCQPDTDSVLIDLELQAALFVILDELAQLLVLLGIRKKLFLQIRVVGINFSKAIVFVEVEPGDLLLSCSSCFSKSSCNL